MLILAWIHLILSWFCDFALNTLDSELVLWFCLEYTWFWVGFVLMPNISQCWVLFLISALLSPALYFILHISSITVMSKVKWLNIKVIKNIRVEKYHVSIWQLCFLAKFAVKMHYVWQGVVVAISRRKRVALCVSWHQMLLPQPLITPTLQLMTSIKLDLNWDPFISSWS